MKLERKSHRVNNIVWTAARLGRRKHHLCYYQSAIAEDMEEGDAYIFDLIKLCDGKVLAHEVTPAYIKSPDWATEDRVCKRCVKVASSQGLNITTTRISEDQ